MAPRRTYVRIGMEARPYHGRGFRIIIPCLIAQQLLWDRDTLCSGIFTNKTVIITKDINGKKLSTDEYLTRSIIFSRLNKSIKAPMVGTNHIIYNDKLIVLLPTDFIQYVSDPIEHPDDIPVPPPFEKPVKLSRSVQQKIYKLDIYKKPKSEASKRLASTGRVCLKCLKPLKDNDYNTWLHESCKVSGYGAEWEGVNQY